MESEASAIARKIQNYIVVENENAYPGRAKRKAALQKKEPGIFLNIILISLMGTAVFFTHISLILIKWVKYLEG